MLAFSLTLVSDRLATAECVEAQNATPESTCVVMMREGVRGVWFSLGEADNIRRMRLELPELRLQNASLERALRISESRIVAYQEANTLRQEALIALQARFDESLERETQLRQQLGVWYRSPSLWLSVGMVLTTVAYIAVMVAVSD